MKEGRQTSYQLHKSRNEVWAIIRGEGIVYIEGKKRIIGSGEAIVIKAGTKHGLYAVADLELIETQLGKPLTESDIIRVEKEWDPKRDE